MATYDISALTSAFVGGAEVFKKFVLQWDLRNLGIQIRTNVNTPQAMAKLDADGEPRPYRAADDYNGATFTDRVLTAYQSKYDLQLDVEELRNTYLADLPEMPFEQYVLQQAIMKFMSKLQSDTVWLGVRNAGGAAAVDIIDGWGTILAADIISGDFPAANVIATNLISAANAVTEVEKVADAVDPEMKSSGFRILCSYNTLQFYRTHYRTLNGFGFNKTEKGQYQLDGSNAVLQPAKFLGTSGRLIATMDNNMVLGTDTERVSVHATPHLNLFQARIMFPIGCQWRDYDRVYVNDHA